MNHAFGLQIHEWMSIMSACHKQEGPDEVRGKRKKDGKGREEEEWMRQSRKGKASWKLLSRMKGSIILAVIGVVLYFFEAGYG